VVVWVFAGGGEAEVRGLIPFLTQNFPGCQFQRKTPVRRKPGPKPNPLMSYGRTGKSLIEQIQEQLPIALKAERNQCDLIFVFDDLDCRNPETQRQEISESLSTILECIITSKVFVLLCRLQPNTWFFINRTYATNQRNRVFLRKYFVLTHRFSKKPGFCGLMRKS
jgi:hypothetical protein